MKDHGTFLENRKESALSAGFIPPEVADFYLALYKEQYSIYNSLKDTGTDFEHIDTRSLPRIKNDRFSFPDEVQKILMDSMNKLIEVIERFNSGLNLQGFLSAAGAEPLFPERIVMLILSRDMDSLGSLAAEIKIAPEEMIFLALNWIKPYFVLISENLGPGIDTTEWHSEFCPICGYLPDMSLIRDAEEGKRYLHCALCEYEWSYKRIACTVCGNEDTKKMGFYTLEDESPYRMDYCDSCRSYIKSLRLSKSKEEEDYDLTVENILTAGLDGYLIDRGYTRP